MKLKSQKLNSLCIATAMALGGAAVPTIAAAGATASVGVANMYLWRGDNLTPDGAQVHGGIEFSGETGLYGGVWTTSEESGHETDLYVGFGGEAGAVSYDISYWWYLYPEDTDGGTPEKAVDLSDNDSSELVVALGAAGFSVEAYIQMDSDNDDNNYYTLGYSYDKYSITYGMWDLEFSDSGDEYTHLTFMYAATDEVTLGVSKAFSDLDDDTGIEEDPLFYVGYDLSFEL